jgi:hypothetical protein
MQASPIKQSFNLTINYQTNLIETKGKALKVFTNLPYTADNVMLTIY